MAHHLSRITTFEVLLVEDSPSDAQLTLEALKEARVANHLSIVQDGVQAMQFLRREGKYALAPRPHLILLDLNLPCKDGREVLAEIKSDETLKTIPVVVLTTSRAQQDVLRASQLNADCYITKPVGFEELLEALTSSSFWKWCAESSGPPSILPAGLLAVEKREESWK
jgi:chemotaxis family two-component system response regulator Rcp1